MKINLLVTILVLGLVTISANPMMDWESDIGEDQSISRYVMNKIRGYFATPESLLQYPKNLFVGLPFEIISTAINFVCKRANGLKLLEPELPPEARNMNLMLMTSCSTDYFPMNRADELVKSPNFDPSKKTLIFSTGWTTHMNGTTFINEVGKTPIYTFLKALMCRGDTNFIALDPAQYIDTLYRWSAINTQLIGKELGEALILLRNHTPLRNIRLMGHSLGAQIVGNAANYYYEKTGEKLHHVTGLDPAKPCFDGGRAITGIRRGVAKFVDIVHSNPGVLGESKALGDVDFYPGGLKPLPKGCLGIACAHNRAWAYMAETMYPDNKYNYIATKCTSPIDLLLQKCNGGEAPMGYDVNKNLRGSYNADINYEFPFGKNSTNQSKYRFCGLCEK